MLDGLKQMFLHEAWADAVQMEAFRSAAEGLLANTDARGRLDHMHLVQRGFLGILEGRKTIPEPIPDLDALQQSMEAYHRAIEAHLAAMTEEGLRRPIEVPWLEGLVLPARDALIQIAMHSQYHRGQNAIRLREAGGDPPVTDFIFWIYKGRPPAAWPSIGRRPGEGQGLEPVRAAVVVDVGVERAFDVFTGELGRWWPMASTFAEDQFETAEIEPKAGGTWFERTRDGGETSWGEVRVYERPQRLLLTFAVSPQKTPEPPERASEVEVRFVAEGPARTRLDLEHRDFARHGEGADRLRADMASPQGWSLILESYARAVRNAPPG